MGIDIPLQVHLDGFKDLNLKGQEFHLMEVHDEKEMTMVPHHQHRALHLSGPAHGFKKGKVKSG
jgi:hypothetical protein